MCRKCEELEEKVERYRRIRDRVLDDLVAAGITRLIEEAEAEKATLHARQSR